MELSKYYLKSNFIETNLLIEIFISEYNNPVLSYFDIIKNINCSNFVASFSINTSIDDLKEDSAVERSWISTVLKSACSYYSNLIAS